MKPIANEFTTHTLIAPRGWDADKNGTCGDLPVHKTDDPYIYSWWKPAWSERLSILFGKPVRVCIVSVSQPPISLHVTAS